jgi:hypothetical protein
MAAGIDDLNGAGKSLKRLAIEVVKVAKPFKLPNEVGQRLLTCRHIPAAPHFETGLT